MMTARDFPEMLKLKSEVDEHGFTIYFGEEYLRLEHDAFEGETYFDLWKQGVLGRVAHSEVNQWFSEKFGQQCQLVYQGTYNRSIPKKEGAELEGKVSYADQAPILMVSNASMKDINQKVGGGITPQHFRPNILIDHDHPFEEDTWKVIKVGEVSFDVLEGCQRCVFTTIDPITLMKHPKQEPLRTLSKYRQHPRGGVSFGIQLVPRNEGMITLHDKVEIIK